MAIGIGVLASRVGFLFLVLANRILVYRLIFREEEASLQSQGDSYHAYCRSVPRLWPSLTPRVPASGRFPQWGQAFAGEGFVWIFGFAELLVAITLRLLIALIAFPFGLIEHFTVTRWIQKGRLTQRLFSPMTEDAAVRRSCRMPRGRENERTPAQMSERGLERALREPGVA